METLGQFMKQTYFAAVLIVRSRDNTFELLLAHRTEGSYMGGTWQLIGGRLEAGEKAWQAALREMREETGLVPIEFYRLDALSHFYRSDDDSLNLAPMFCAIVDPGAVVTLNPEHSDFAWVNMEEAHSRLMWPGDIRALEEVKAVILGNGTAKPYMRIPL
jgi:dATP pyrophosphohydrolase